jgi:hypothetical protein
MATMLSMYHHLICHIAWYLHIHRHIHTHADVRTQTDVYIGIGRRVDTSSLQSPQCTHGKPKQKQYTSHSADVPMRMLCQ